MAASLEVNRSDGMPASCALAADNTTLVRVSLFTERITRLAPERVQAACDALALATAC
ncbi:MAG: hypothetical protein ACRDL0_12440 [Thermoleophilaceae bacterium]